MWPYIGESTIILDFFFYIVYIYMVHFVSLKFKGNKADLCSQKKTLSSTIQKTIIDSLAWKKGN